MTQHLYILTGGSRGMGLAIAEQLLKLGHTLICISRNQQASLTELAQKSGATLAQWSHDLADGAAASKALLTWLQAQKPNEFQSATLINNAGVIPRMGQASVAPRKAAHNCMGASKPTRNAMARLWGSASLRGPMRGMTPALLMSVAL